MNPYRKLLQQTAEDERQALVNLMDVRRRRNALILRAWRGDLRDGRRVPGLPITDIAAEAGLSRQAVHLVINDHLRKLGHDPGRAVPGHATLDLVEALEADEGA